MPIDRSKYPADWNAISLRIRARENQECKFCRAPNGQLIGRSVDGKSYMRACGEVLDSTTGESLGLHTMGDYRIIRFVKVVLTVAQLDHDTTNNDDANLAALCQQCHLRYDKALHAENAQRTRRLRKAEGGLC